MSRSPAIVFILLCIFLDALGIGLIVPVLPKLIGTLTTSASEQSFWYGAIMISFGLAQFLFSPLLGALSDRYGRRPILLIGIAGMSLMFLVPAISDSLWAIFFSRVFGGILSANWVVAQAYISDLYEDQNLTVALGKVSAAFGLGFIIGPSLGGLLGNHNLSLPFFLAFSVCLVNFCYGLFILPESLSKKIGSKITFKRVNPFSAVYQLFARRYSTPLLVSLALLSLFQGVIHSTWALFSEFQFKATPQDIGLSILVFGLSIALTQALVLNFLLKKTSEFKIVFFATMISAVALLAIGLSPNYRWATGALCLSALSSMMSPIFLSLLNREKKLPYGLFMGSVHSLNNAMGAISPLLGVSLLTLSWNPFSENLFGLPFIFSAILCVLIFLFTRFAQKKAIGN